MKRNTHTLNIEEIMDKLYLSPQAASKLTKFCESDLIKEITAHFAKNAPIFARDNDSSPSRLWVVTDFVADDTIDQRKKVSVILSYAAIGGFVQIGERTEMGDVNVLIMLKETNNISEAVFDYFIEAFYNFSHGNGQKFTA